MGLLKRKTEQTVEETVRNAPHSSAGIVVNTEDLVESDIKNPWLMSLYSLSTTELNSIVDQIKVGYSVVARSPLGSKEPEVYLNPKNLIDAGFEGKSRVITSDQEHLFLADLNHSGGNVQIPTILGGITINRSGALVGLWEWVSPDIDETGAESPISPSEPLTYQGGNAATGTAWSDAVKRFKPQPVDNASIGRGEGYRGFYTPSIPIR